MAKKERNKNELIKEKNSNQKKGVSEYPNHYDFKKIRLFLLIKNNWKCFICGNEATEVHHIDEDKSNHNEDNLMCVCRKCHISRIHAGRKNKTSKYIRLFGYSIIELSSIVGCSTAAISNAFKFDNTEMSKWIKIKIEEYKNRVTDV